MKALFLWRLLNSNAQTNTTKGVFILIVKFNLKEIIHKRGMTYTQFGQKFNPVLDVPQVSRMAKSNSITFERLAQVCEALDLTPEELPELIKMYDERKTNITP